MCAGIELYGQLIDGPRAQQCSMSNAVGKPRSSIGWCREESEEMIVTRDASKSPSQRGESWRLNKSKSNTDPLNWTQTRQLHAGYQEMIKGWRQRYEKYTQGISAIMQGS